MAAIVSLSLGASYPGPPRTCRGTIRGAMPTPAAITARRDSPPLFDSFEFMTSVSFFNSISHQLDPHQCSLRGQTYRGTGEVALRSPAEHGPFPDAVLENPFCHRDELGRGEVRPLHRPPFHG